MKGPLFSSAINIAGKRPQQSRNEVDAVFRITAQQDLYSAHSTLISTRADRLANLITLYKALGGDWR